MVMEPSGAEETFQGKFYQITRDTNVETLGSLWTPYYPRWHGWAYWGPAPEEGFIEYYTGHVLAILSTPNGERMRCRFQLLRSSEGMKGGGEGQCQLPSGQTVSADFPPA